MFALWVERTLAKKGLLGSSLQVGGLLFLLGGVVFDFWLALASSLQVVKRNLVAGWTVGFYLFTLLLSSNDDIASISADIVDRAEITGGRVIKISSCLLVHLRRAAPMLGALCIG